MSPRQPTAKRSSSSNPGVFRVHKNVYNRPAMAALIDSTLPKQQTSHPRPGRSPGWACVSDRDYFRLSLPGGYLFGDHAAIARSRANGIRYAAADGGGFAGFGLDLQRVGTTCFCLGQRLIQHQDLRCAGILLGGIGITLIGFAPGTTVVFLMYAVGMLGIGMFHPIAASTIGQLAGDRRGIAISWFFVFGMGGFFTGALLAPWLATGNGSLKHLAVMIIPGLLMAVVLQLWIGKINHKAVLHPTAAHSMRLYDWRSIWILYLSSVFRFVVNMAIVYLLVRWMEQSVAANQPEWSAKQIADFSAPLAGRANATMILGQGTGGLVAGALIARGREKWPLVLTPILFAPAPGIDCVSPTGHRRVRCLFLHRRRFRVDDAGCDQRWSATDAVSHQSRFGNHARRGLGGCCDWTTTGRVLDSPFQSTNRLDHDRRPAGLFRGRCQRFEAGCSGTKIVARLTSWLVISREPNVTSPSPCELRS